MSQNVSWLGGHRLSRGVRVDRSHLGLMLVAGLLLYAGGCGSSSPEIRSDLPTSTEELIAAYTKAFDSGDEAAIRKLFLQGTSSPEDFEASIKDAIVGIGKYKVVETDITDLSNLPKEAASARDELEFGYPVAKAIEVQVDAKQPLGPGEDPSRWMLLAVSEEEGHAFPVAGRMK